jgi:hypothetical protein
LPLTHGIIDVEERANVNRQRLTVDRQRLNGDRQRLTGEGTHQKLGDQLEGKNEKRE